MNCYWFYGAKGFKLFLLTKVNNKTPKTAPKNCETISKTPLVEFMRDFPCHSIKPKVTAGLYCPPLILAEKMDSTQSEIASEKSLQDMKTKVNINVPAISSTNCLGDLLI